MFTSVEELSSAVKAARLRCTDFFIVFGNVTDADDDDETVSDEGNAVFSTSSFSYSIRTSSDNV